MNIVVDAGVILKGYFADEDEHEDAQLIIKEYAEINDGIRARRTGSRRQNFFN